MQIEVQKFIKLKQQSDDLWVYFADSNDYNKDNLQYMQALKALYELPL